ncbi:uncharacterized protein LOC131235610 isoform X2 [Magnolia sinica]|uniref:uncharacterized protein LOC131235610 isoform X2 n=1 Tax=Magnolia sinica TaxID=86752 RepID=UPI002657F501|nr:uncharacterized protein LOC131235610 isoform X2 [Magnolia sinica]
MGGLSDDPHFRKQIPRTADACRVVFQKSAAENSTPLLPSSHAHTPKSPFSFLRERERERERECKRVRGRGRGEMGEGKGSTLVHLLAVVLCLVAFGFAIAAERRRSTVRDHDESNNSSYCVYDSDIATGYGVGSFLFLLSSESLMMGVTKCMCFGRPLAPGGNRAWAIIYFASSWLTFLIAEACLIAGAAKNAYHTKYRSALYADNWSCESLRKGVFIAGAVFVVFTMILNVYYYMYFTRATSQAARKTSKTNSTVGMTGYA